MNDIHTQFQSKPETCLNCGAPTTDKYCAHCAQSTHTARLDIKHFIDHDIVHGVFHMDRGFPKTLASVLATPGKVAWDYILGRRKRYYNFFYMLLILLGIMLYLHHQTTPEDVELQKGFTVKLEDGKQIELRPFINQNLKYIYILFVPFFAIAGKIFLPRLRLNFVEHNLPAVMAVLGMTFINTLTNLVTLIGDKFSGFQDFTDVIALIPILMIMTLVFPVYSYFLFTQRGGYSIAGRVWRSLAIGLFFIVLVFIGLGYVYLYLTH